MPACEFGAHNWAVRARSSAGGAADGAPIDRPSSARAVHSAQTEAYFGRTQGALASDWYAPMSVPDGPVRGPKPR
jgi:hypothetical protein